MAAAAIAIQASETGRVETPFSIRFCAFLGAAVVYVALATMNAWPNVDAALHGDYKAGATAFVQYVFAFIVAISSLAVAHEKGGKIAVLVFMLVNGYFAYDAASHRHDDVKTSTSRKEAVSKDLDAKQKAREAIGNFERVMEDQITEAKRKRDVTEADRAYCDTPYLCKSSTKKARTTAATEAQTALERLMPLHTKTAKADDLDKAIDTLQAEMKGFGAAADSDDSLAQMAGANASTITTTLTLLLALGIELANKYGPCWTFRFVVSGFGFYQASPHDLRKAAKEAEKLRRDQEKAEEEARRRSEAEARARAEAERQERLSQERAEAEAKAKLEAKKERAKTRQPGDPATVKSWVNGARTVMSPGHVLDVPDAYADYLADCRAHNEAHVAKGKQFIGELRALGFEVREIGKRKHYQVVGLALTGARSSGLRIVSSK